MTLPVLEDKITIVTGVVMGKGKGTAKPFEEAKTKDNLADFN